MQTNYSEALAEVNEILKFTDPNLTKNIPVKFKEFIKTNMSKTYKYTIPENNSDINLKPETKTILALIYRNYFCSAEEKQFLIEKDFQFSIKNEQEIKINNLVSNNFSNILRK